MNEGVKMARVLVVDDAMFMRSVIKGILVSAGHKVIAEASDGEDAYRKYITYRPDLVTMDITMPGIDGVEGARRILEFDPDANVVMISAMAQKSMVLKAIKYGAKYYIIKPVNKSKVIEVTNAVLKLENVVKCTQEEVNEIKSTLKKINNDIDAVDGAIDSIDAAIEEISR